MKTKLLTLCFMLFLGGCTLAAREYVPIENPDQPSIPSDQVIGIYIGAFNTSQNEIPKFNKSDSSQTFFLVDQERRDGETYNFSKVSGNFFSSHTNHILKDDGTDITFTASLPILSSKSSFIRAYVIRKNNQGDYYTELINNYHPLGLSNITLQESYTEEVNGEFTMTTISFNLSFEHMDPLVQTRILRMNDQYQVLSELFIDSETTVELHNSNEMIIIEETRSNQDNDEYIIRKVYSYNEIKKDREVRHMLVGEDDHIFGRIFNVILKIKE